MLRLGSMLFLLVTVSCSAQRDDIARTIDLSEELRTSARPSQAARESYLRRTVTISEAPSSGDGFGDAVSLPSIVEEEPLALSLSDARTFRNTYYNFPSETEPGTGATIYDASCRKIADVSKAFHDTLCIQGSGRIASGQTVSFARRDCECAMICPRTDQRICFEALDPDEFPWGRGALGKAITPLSSVAVDTSVIPFHTRLFIPEAVGLPRQDGSLHDGCFVAEDRGLKIKGEHVDIFTGDPATTKIWNSRLPSNLGVTVIPNAPECAD